MAKIEIPEEFLDKLGPSMSMDIHFIDVKLKSGKVYKKLVVRGGLYITGEKEAKDGVSNLDFDSEDISKIRRTSFLPFL